MDKKLHAYISEIIFNNGVKLPIAENDIVLFVGPNNVGKSQALKDIYIKCEKTVRLLLLPTLRRLKKVC